MSSRRNTAAVIDSPAAPAAPAPGDVVCYITDELIEVRANVIAAEGDHVDLAYRDGSGALRVAEGVRRAPGLALHWGWPGERSERPRGPEAGDRPILVDSPVVLHRSSCDGVTERFEVVSAVVVKILDDGAFVADPIDGSARRLRPGSYSGERFRKGGWSWPQDDVTAPAPRREVFAVDRPIVCPVTGQSVPRKAAIPVSIGGTSAPDVFSNDGLLSPDGAAALRAFLAGDVETLTRAPVELVD